jgi:pseudaminic acid cytidylyltransferase
MIKLAVIPARGGSKRIEDKNIRLFAGQPLIAWSIKAAIKAGIFDRIIVSTDSDKVASIAKSYRAEVPFMRPAALADDHAPIADVLKHAVRFYEAMGHKVAYSCCIYATAPMISADDIGRGLTALQSHDKHRCALAVTSFAFPIQRALTLDAEKGLKMIHPEHRLTRSQDLETCYHDAGQFFWVDHSRDHSKNEGMLPVFIDRRRVQDIDTEEDWYVAENLHKALLMGSLRGQAHA